MWKIFSQGHILSTIGDALTSSSSGSSGVQFAELLLKLVCYSCGGEVGGGAKGGDDETSFSELFGSFEEYYILALLVVLCVCNAIR